jgi:aminoglycoside phosphotransferase (APT) family kinase protein
MRCRVVLAHSRDLAAVRTGLEAWLGAPVVELAEPSGGGLSSETYLFRTTDERLVLRLPPTGDALFPTYDLGQQARVMSLLDGVVPVPRVRASVDDATFFGAPFLVMEHVEGRVPTDNPSYLLEGWLKDASADEQRVVHDRFAACCARVHRTAADRFGDADLRRGLAPELAWWSDYLLWAADGTAPAQLVEALAWCASNVPDDPPSLSLCWGDVRLPNVIFDDNLEPAAVLDWEMASIAPAELDLAWFLVVHGMSVEVAGGDLPGFRDRIDFVERYARLLGRALDDLRWYEVWAAFRSAAIMVRLASLLHGLGLVGDQRMRERNPSTKLLRQLLS